MAMSVQYTDLVFRYLSDLYYKILRRVLFSLVFCRKYSEKVLAGGFRYVATLTSY